MSYLGSGLGLEVNFDLELNLNYVAPVKVAHSRVAPVKVATALLSDTAKSAGKGVSVAAGFAGCAGDMREGGLHNFEGDIHALGGISYSRVSKGAEYRRDVP